MSAAIGVRFIEGAPKDRFEITNQAACAVVAAEIVIDLSASPAGLIFDVTGTGAGIEVFQPFELAAGAEALATQPKVVDGERGIPGVIPGNSVLEFQVQLLGVKRR